MYVGKLRPTNNQHPAGSPLNDRIRLDQNGAMGPTCRTYPAIELGEAVVEGRGEVGKLVLDQDQQCGMGLETPKPEYQPSIPFRSLRELRVSVA